MTKMSTQHPLLYLKTIPDKGRGVFAKKKIVEGQKFLVDPIVMATYDDLKNYIFEYDGKVFIGLGLSSLINHSFKGNCEWVAEVRSKLPTITFIATKDIEKGQEILHDYQWDEFPDNFV